MKRTSRSKFLYYIYLILLIFPCLEFALLILGYRPYQQLEYQIESKPKNCIIASSNKGFALHPGEFEVNINQGLNYTASHNADSLRINSIREVGDENIRPKIFMFGCSYTYGMGVQDHETFSYIIQESLPENEIINFGVPGFGNVQSYMQLKEQLAKGIIPELVIINYANFHNERNALSQSYRRDLFMGFQRSNKNTSLFDQNASIPYIQKTDSTFTFELENWITLYKNWKGRERFATINLMQNLIENWSENKSDKDDVTIFIFREFKMLCDQYGIKLLITGLTQNEETQEMLHYLSDLNIQTINISVDLLSDQYNNQPFDSHPNTVAHQHYADEILKLIK